MAIIYFNDRSKKSKYIAMQYITEWLTESRDVWCTRNNDSYKYKKVCNLFR